MVFEQTRELEGIRIVSRCPFVGRTTPRSIGERARAHRPPDPFRPSRRDAGGRQPGGRRFHPVAAAARAVAVSRAERAPSCTRATYSYHAWVSRAAGGDRGRPPCERIDRSRRPQVVPARGGGGGGTYPGRCAWAPVARAHAAVAVTAPRLTCAPALASRGARGTHISDSRSDTRICAITPLHVSIRRVAVAGQPRLATSHSHRSSLLLDFSSPDYSFVQ